VGKYREHRSLGNEATQVPCAPFTDLIYTRVCKLLQQKEAYQSIQIGFLPWFARDRNRFGRNYH
jgi:hypothetical protein